MHKLQSPVLTEVPGKWVVMFEPKDSKSKVIGLGDVDTVIQPK